MASNGSAPSTRAGTLAASQSRARWRYSSRSSATAPHLGEGHATIRRVLTWHAEESLGDQVALHLVAAAGQRAALAHEVLGAGGRGAGGGGAGGGGADDAGRPGQLEPDRGDAHGA